MKFFKQGFTVLIFYIVLILSSFVPTFLAMTIIFLNFIGFVTFLFYLNWKAQQELEHQKTDYLWFFVINVVAFNLLELAILYGIIGWVICL